MGCNLSKQKAPKYLDNPIKVSESKSQILTKPHSVTNNPVKENINMPIEQNAIEIDEKSLEHSQVINQRNLQFETTDTLQHSIQQNLREVEQSNICVDEQVKLVLENFYSWEFRSSLNKLNKLIEKPQIDDESKLNFRALQAFMVIQIHEFQKSIAEKYLQNALSYLFKSINQQSTIYESKNSQFLYLCSSILGIGYQLLGKDEEGQKVKEELNICLQQLKKVGISNDTSILIKLTLAQINTKQETQLPSNILSQDEIDKLISNTKLMAYFELVRGKLFMNQKDYKQAKQKFEETKLQFEKFRCQSDEVLELSNKCKQDNQNIILQTMQDIGYWNNILIPQICRSIKICDEKLNINQDLTSYVYKVSLKVERNDLDEYLKLRNR